MDSQDLKRSEVSLHVSQLCSSPLFLQVFLSVYIFDIYLVAGSPGFTF